MNFRRKIPIKLQKFTTKGAFVKLSMLPFALVTIGFFILLRPFVIIQIYKVHDWRIGHMVSTTQRFTFEVFEWNLAHKRKKIILYFFGSKNSANDYFKKLLMQNHYSIQNNWGFLIYYLGGFSELIVPHVDGSVLDKEGLLLKHSSTITIPQQDVEVGQKFLDECGLTRGGKFVCLNVRDGAYLSATRKKDFSKHNLRNSDINSYTGAVKALLDLGYVVFRMGAIVEKHLDFKHAKLFDYAANGMRTEFLDIFLGANCSFCISTGSGWDEIPRIFKRPTLYVNYLPFLAAEIVTRDLLMFPKYMRDKKTKKLLTLNEYFESDLFGQANPYWIEEFGGTTQDLSSDDLTLATVEMVERVEGRFIAPTDQITTHHRLRQNLSIKSKFQPTDNYFPIRAEFASSFLSNNPNFLD